MGRPRNDALRNPKVDASALDPKGGAVLRFSRPGCRLDSGRLNDNRLDTMIDAMIELVINQLRRRCQMTLETIAGAMFAAITGNLESLPVALKRLRLRSSEESPQLIVMCCGSLVPKLTSRLAAEAETAYPLFAARCVLRNRNIEMASRLRGSSQCNACTNWPRSRRAATRSLQAPCPPGADRTTPACANHRTERRARAQHCGYWRLGCVTVS